MSCPIHLKLNHLTLNNLIRINENEPGNKKSKYFQRTNDGKQILRDMMTRYIPEDITKAEKQGFSSPDASWFKGDSIEFVRKILHNNKANIYLISNEIQPSESSLPGVGHRPPQPPRVGWAARADQSAD